MDKIERYLRNLSPTTEQLYESLCVMIEAKKSELIMEGHLYERNPYSASDVRYELLALCAAREVIEKDLGHKENDEPRSYKFTVKCHTTTMHCNKMLFGDETYELSTMDFDRFVVTDKNSDSFVINRLSEIADDIIIIEADKETIEEFHKHFYNEPLATRMYGDLGVEYGILYRIPFGEESLEGLDSAECSENEGFLYYTFNNNFIDEENDSFYYEIRISPNTGSLVSANRIYDSDTIPMNTTEEQLDIIMNKVEKDLSKQDIKKRNTKEYCDY